MKLDIVGERLVQGRKSGTAVLFGAVMTYAVLQKQALRSEAHRASAISHSHYTTWSPLLLLPSGVDKANKAKGREP